jgi:hypothetical protein
METALWPRPSAESATVAALLDKVPDLTLKDNFYGRAARLAALAPGCSDVLSLIE